MTTPDEAPPAGAHGLAARAFLEGQAAGRDGLLPGACPYPAARPFSRRVWCQGYAVGRTERGDVVELEDVEPAEDVDA